jgi:hypothetical protein
MDMIQEKEKQQEFRYWKHFSYAIATAMTAELY